MHNSRDYHFRGRASFRALNLSEKQAELFLTKVHQSKCKKYPDKLVYCGTAELNEVTVPTIIQFCHENDIPQDDCDIFLSISTESDSEIVDVPAIVNSLVREFDCRLRFSFTVI